MAELNWMQRNGLSPVKAALIGVLALIFLSVVGYQVVNMVFRGETQQQVVTILKPVVKNAIKRAAGIPNLPTEDRLAPAPEWPAYPLEEVLQYDPFQLPPQMRPKAVVARAGDGSAPSSVETSQVDSVKLAVREALQTRRKKRLSDMQQRGADVVIVGGNTALAVIDGVELRVGDVVDGLRIENITRLGIELVEVEPKP